VEGEEGNPKSLGGFDKDRDFLEIPVEFVGVGKKVEGTVGMKS